MSKCHENCVGKQACVQLIRNAEAKAAEKAKADKLAILDDIKKLPIWSDRIYLRREDVIEAIQRRIEDE